MSLLHQECQTLEKLLEAAVDGSIYKADERAK